jgi:TctA family transporter
MAVAVLLVLCRWVAVLTFVDGRLLAPFIMSFAALGCYVSAFQWQNLVVLVMFGALGYALLRGGWPRAPLVIGLVLGGEAEESLNLALQLDGYLFFLRPLSLLLTAIILCVLAYALYRNVSGRRYRSGVGQTDE